MKVISTEISSVNYPYKALLIALYLLLFFLLSLYIANYTKNTDFPVFYSTAKTVLGKGISSNAIYIIDRTNQHQIPEPQTDLTFIYSKAAALILSPLGFLPYYYAKATMIFINMVAYLSGTFLLLNLLGFTGRNHFYFWGLAFFWPPFLQAIRFGQIDGLLFFLIVFALHLAQNKRLFSAGIAIGTAMLFKISPLALAMTFAVKSRKVLIGCLLIFTSSFIVPGACDWFKAVPAIDPRAFSLIYVFLKSQNIWLYIAYCILIGGTTALIVYKNKLMTYCHIVAITLPAIYLTMPVVEYYHLTSLILTFLFLLSKIKFRPITIGFLLIVSYFLLSICIKFELPIFTFIGISLLWIFLSSVSLQEPFSGTSLNISKQFLQRLP